MNARSIRRVNKNLTTFSFNETMIPMILHGFDNDVRSGRDCVVSSDKRTEFNYDQNSMRQEEYKFHTLSIIMHGACISWVTDHSSTPRFFIQPTKATAPWHDYWNVQQPVHTFGFFGISLISPFMV